MKEGIPADMERRLEPPALDVVVHGGGRDMELGGHVGGGEERKVAAWLDVHRRGFSIPILQLLRIYTIWLCAHDGKEIPLTGSPSSRQRSAATDSASRLE